MLFSKNGGESMVFSLYPVPQELDELLRGTCAGDRLVECPATEVRNRRRKGGSRIGCGTYLT